MTTATYEVPSPLERLMNDQRVRIGGLIAGALVIVVSLVVGNLAQEPSRARATKAVAVLPEQPLNLPVLRHWPYETPKPAIVQTVRAPAAKAVRRGR
jgi:hypothetical protein